MEVLSLLTLVFALEAGPIRQAEALGDQVFRVPDGSSYIMLEAEGRVGPLFVGGAVETQQRFVDNGNPYPEFSPFRAIYTFETGFRWRGITFAWSHICDHPVVPARRESTAYNFVEDRVYLRIEGELKWH